MFNHWHKLNRAVYIIPATYSGFFKFPGSQDIVIKRESPIRINREKSPYFLNISIHGLDAVSDAARPFLCMMRVERSLSLNISAIFVLHSGNDTALRTYR